MNRAGKTEGSGEDSARIDFTAPTRRLVAARAGHRCSMPQCGRLTIGPDTQPNEFVDSGVAAHIFSAASGGPRGQGGLSAEQLASASNAIWLCAIHGRIVDANRGMSYPAPLLLSYKGLHEGRMFREQHGLGLAVFWFQELTLHQSPLFAPRSNLRFGKLTVLVGENSKGKTALCEWISSFASPGDLWRWIRPFSPLDAELQLHMPDQHNVRLQLLKPQELRFAINSTPAASQALPIHFVFLREKLEDSLAEEMDDTKWIARQLGIDPLLLPNLFEWIQHSGSGWVKTLDLRDRPKDEEEENPPNEKWLYADLKGGGEAYPYRDLSGAEQTIVLLELAIALAQSRARYVPTMLILDSGMWRFDRDNFQRVADRLCSSDLLFQSLIVIPPRPKELLEPKWAGWVIARMKSSPDGTIIDQHSFTPEESSPPCFCGPVSC